MFLLSIILLCTSLALLAWVAAAQHRTQRELRDTRQEVEQLAKAAAALPPDLPNVLGARKGPLLALEILNSQELAARESFAADAFGGLIPGVIRNMVYKQAMPIVIQELEKHGVKAQVDIYHAG